MQKSEIAGWYGVIAILLAYGLLSFQVITSGLWYQLLNATGAAAIVIDALDDKNWQPAVLNIVWAAIAVFSLLRIWLW